MQITAAHVDTRGWVAFRRAGVECYRAPDGRDWTEAEAGEIVEAISQTKITKKTLYWVSASGSTAVARAEKKARKAERELSKRGY